MPDLTQSLSEQIKEAKARGYDLIAQQESLTRQIQENNQIILDLLNKIRSLEKPEAGPEAA